MRLTQEEKLRMMKDEGFCPRCGSNKLTCSAALTKTECKCLKCGLKASD